MIESSRSRVRSEIRRRMGRRMLVAAALSLAFPATPSMAEDPAAIEFFEKSIRPLIVEKCQSCHGPGKAKAGLRMTDRGSLLKGGDSGPAVVPNAPEESRLIQAVRYLDEPKMPPKQKLTAAEIAALERWVASGAPWPSSAARTTSPARFEPTPAQRRWWAFQPVRSATPSTPNGPRSAENQIDDFLLEASRSQRHRARPRRTGGPGSAAPRST